MSELRNILGENKKTINIAGKSIELTPIKVKNLSVVLEKKELIESVFKGNILQSISTHFDDVVELVASISGVEKDFIENLELPQVIDFVEAIIDINKEGFFLIQTKLQKITENKIKTQAMNGAKPSSSSSKKATASKESRATQ